MFHFVFSLRISNFVFHATGSAKVVYMYLCKELFDDNFMKEYTDKTLFINSNDRLFMKVRPFEGKYSVKCSDFYEQVGRRQSEVLPDSWLYRPLNSEIEITNRCNQSCAHCGMAANHTIYQAYTADELVHFAEELYQNGIPSYSITGGEPFLALDNMLSLIRSARGKVDVCKITSNGYWGEKAEKVFDMLEEAGLFDNRFFVPCLMISIGEQSTPMKTTCKIFHHALQRYGRTQLTLCISSLSEFGSPSKVDEFISTYNEHFGEIPAGRIFLTENYYRNSSCIRDNANAVPFRKVEDYMSGPVRCFEQTIGKYVLPRLLVKATGEICTCACFNAPKELKIGDYRQESIRDILQKINDNTIVNIIADKGLHGFKSLLSPSDYIDVPCSNECEACTHLIHSYTKRYGE